MAKLAAPLMTDGGTMFAMSYHGAQKVVPNYNVMGPVKAALEASCRYLAYELGEKRIRVHPISPGPLKTRAASGLKDFDLLLNEAASRAPIGELVDIDDVGLYLRVPRHALCAAPDRPDDLRRRRRVNIVAGAGGSVAALLVHQDALVLGLLLGDAAGPGVPFGPPPPPARGLFSNPLFRFSLKESDRDRAAGGRARRRGAFSCPASRFSPLLTGWRARKAPRRLRACRSRRPSLP